jgi:hypothetical protein
MILLAVILTVSHNIIAHDHHEVRLAEHDEHDDDEDDDHNRHTFFSYGQLAESFTHDNSHIDLKNDYAIKIFIEPLASLSVRPHFFTLLNTLLKQVGKDYLPPQDLFPAARSLRAPPGFIG